LPPGSARTDGAPDALTAALDALRAELIDLADDVEAEPRVFDKRIVPYLRRIAARIPGQVPPQSELFRLAHAKESLQGYVGTVNEQWPDHLAQRFHKFTHLFDRTVRQFPKWRGFVRNAETDRLTPEQVAAVPNFAKEFVEAMRDDDAQEFIDPALPVALENLQSPLHPDRQRVDDQLTGASAPMNVLLAEDIVESINNTVKLTVEAALASAASVERKAKADSSTKKDGVGLRGTAEKAASAFARKAEKSMIKEAERLGQGTGPAVTKWVKRFIFSGGALATWVQLSPKAFEWLAAIKPFLGLH
jgi:hypothetical protein